ncbi:MAG: riboflavin synthase [Acidobacteriota bacterium]|nr:MAG: riboflavin synthase [Acidobacteriota bacterium]
MFTGIIEELGTLRKVTPALDGARIEVSARQVLEDARTGDSIAVNGVCLTVVDRGTDWFAADISAETLSRTSLKAARPGARVNLERPLTPSSRLGGHIVQGHVDGTGTYLEARASGDGWIVRIGFPQDLARYIVEKGSIAVDGISLTVATLGTDWLEIAIIPHTWKVTNLSSLERGDPVNLEVDIIAKYVERMLGAFNQTPKNDLTIEKLKEMGY